MNLTQRVVLAVSLFAAAGGAGPVLRLVIAPPSSFEDPLSPVAGFVYNLTAYLWPTWLLAQGAPPGLWGKIAIASNVLLFASVGLVVGVVSRRRAATLGICVAMTGVLLILAFWVWQIVDWIPLMVAVLVLATPYAIVLRATASMQFAVRSERSHE